MRTSVEFVNDTERKNHSKLVRLACRDPKPTSQTWARWRQICGIPKNVQYLTDYETLLLLCCSQWGLVKAFHGIVKRRSPTFFELTDYGIPWVINAQHEFKDIVKQILFSEDGGGVDPGVDGKDLVAAIRDLAGKARCENTIRSRCQKLGWKYSRNKKYSHRQLLKLCNVI